MPVFYPTELPDGGFTFSVPSPLYHYTTQEVLLKILRSEELWCSDLRYLADRAEVKQGINLIRQILPSGDTWQDELTELRIRLRQAAKSFLNHRIFVCCFSVERDLLSQWRAYCPEPGGVAIGFSGTRMRQLARDASLDLRKCIYGENDQLDELRAIIDRVVEEYRSDRQAGAQRSSSLMHEHVGNFKQLLLPRIIRFKHPTFREENEWRLSRGPVGLNEDSVCFRPGGTALLPYLPFQLERDDHGRLPIEHVVIGPTPDESLAVASVEHVLRKYEVSAQVTTSETPYRSW